MKAKTAADPGPSKRDKIRLVVEGLALVAAVILGIFTYQTLVQVKRQSAAMEAQVAEMRSQFGNQERPWVKISHRIVSPLTFDIGGRASGKNVALMTVEDTIENVGKSVALNVKSWEDLIPVEPSFSLKAAQKRQTEWCEANRFQQGNLTGEIMFPNDPAVHRSIVGPTMEKIQETINAPANVVPGKISFVLVGCVLYKATWEGPNIPAHKTGFLYFVGTVEKEGVMNGYVVPKGVAPQLRLISMPTGQTAD